MGNRPLVSVVVPTCNRPAYLAEALESLIAQTFGDFEALVGNDGEPATLWPARERFDDPRIMWIDNPVPKGMLRNIVELHGRARGRYVVQLHDDDRWAPELLAELVPPLEADPDVSVAFADHFVIDEHGDVDPAATKAASKRFGRDSLAPGLHRPFRRLALIDGAVPIPCAALARRDALDLDQFPDRVGPRVDLWIRYQLCRDGAGAFYVPRRLAFYRAHGGSQTATRTLENSLADVYCYTQFLEDPRLLEIPRADLRRELASSNYGVAASLLRQGDRAMARDPLWQSFAFERRPRTALALTASLLPRPILTRL